MAEINLGLVRAIQVSTTEPINTKMLWFDENANNIKYFNPDSNDWVVLALDPDGLSIEIVNDKLTTIRSDDVTSNDSNINASTALVFKKANLAGGNDFTGNQSVNGNVSIDGNLVVNGTTQSQDTQNLLVADNIITLNRGEQGAGVSVRYAGVEIDLGTLTNQAILWDQTDGVWKVGEFTSVAVDIISATSTTITLDTDASDVDDFYNGNFARVFKTGEVSQAFTITDYVGATRTATVDITLSPIPDNTWDIRIIRDSDLKPLAYIADLPIVKLEEGGKTGMIRSSEDLANHGEIGNRAIDLTYSSNPSATVGALGEDSFAINKENSSIGDKSFTAGEGNIAGYGNQTVIGKYNSNLSNSLFEVGNGASNISRANAFSVNTNGTTIISSSDNEQLKLGYGTSVAPNIGFYENTTLRASISYLTGVNGILINNEETDTGLSIDAGNNGLKYRTITDDYDVYHEGNLPSELSNTTDNTGLTVGAGINGLEYTDNASSYTVYHSGNVPYDIKITNDIFDELGGVTFIEIDFENKDELITSTAQNVTEDLQVQITNSNGTSKAIIHLFVSELLINLTFINDVKVNPVIGSYDIPTKTLTLSSGNYIMEINTVGSEYWIDIKGLYQ